MIPEINKKYPFFDDGKISSSRYYVATIVQHITLDEAKTIMFNHYSSELDTMIEASLYDIWREEVDDHRQSKNFVVHNGCDTTPGSPWLYAEETDLIIAASIPKYDDDLIYFVRDVRGGWFSMDVTNSWQSGELDTDLSALKALEELYPEFYKEEIKCYTQK